MEKLALMFRPKMIICGASAYPRDWDYARVRKICDAVGAYMMSDIAHISGLVATGEAKNAFDFCDIVTTTTHKSLRGPRAGMIFFRRGAKESGGEYDYEEKINQAVFPSLQGGPHNHQIAGLATQLKEVATPEFKAYTKQVKANAAALAKFLVSKGYKLATDGTGARPHLQRSLRRLLTAAGKRAVERPFSPSCHCKHRRGPPPPTPITVFLLAACRAFLRPLASYPPPPRLPGSAALFLTPYLPPPSQRTT